MSNVVTSMSIGFWLLFFPSFAQAEVNDFACGSLHNGYGPFDFRSDKDKLPIVEGAHFTPEVANLIRGRTGPIGGDLDYTLRAFPNHPGALMSMIRLSEKKKGIKPLGARYSTECYFQRAVRFRADDTNVRMIYAIYLSKNQRAAEALKQLDDAHKLGEESANFYYNAGLIYFGLGRYDEALTNAHRAYQAGFSLPGLRNKLKESGKWREPDRSSTKDIETTN